MPATPARGRCSTASLAAFRRSHGLLPSHSWSPAKTRSPRPRPPPRTSAPPRAGRGASDRLLGVWVRGRELSAHFAAVGKRARSAVFGGSVVELASSRHRRRELFVRDDRPSSKDCRSWSVPAGRGRTQRSRSRPVATARAPRPATGRAASPNRRARPVSYGDLMREYARHAVSRGGSSPCRS